MVETDNNLDYSDRMRHFFSVQSGGDAVPGLTLTAGRRTFRLHLLHATLAETHRCAHARHVRGHRHADAYHAVLYTSGRNRFVLHDQSLPCKPGTLVLTAPEDAHDFRPARAGTVAYSEVTFAFRDSAGRPLRLPFARLLHAIAGGAAAEDAAGETAARPFCRQLTPPAMAEANARYAALFDALADPGALRPLRMHEAFVQFLLFWWRELEPAGAPRHGASPSMQAVERVRLHLEQHVAETAGIPRLAALAKMSEGHFQRQFKRLTGLTPVQYQQRLRIRAAQTLLRTSSLSCKEIAARLGFHDPAYFSRLVRRHTGHPPQACR